MNNVFMNHWREGAGPAREQNLFVSLSKHLYCLKDGTLKYQQKALDPRLPGKTLLLRLVLLDTDTGTLYGELHERENVDLVGFLARAWVKKPQHPMHGLPYLLNVPRVVHSTQPLLEAVQDIWQITKVNIGEMPAGFAAGVHAVREFERVSEESLLWRFDDKPTPNLEIAQACSALLSTMASNSLAHTWEQAWAQIAPVAPEILAQIDACYEPAGAWRNGPFRLVLDGLPGVNVAGETDDVDGRGDIA